jgi:hypothetical protein
MIDMTAIGQSAERRIDAALAALVRGRMELSRPDRILSATTTPRTVHRTAASSGQAGQ